MDPILLILIIGGGLLLVLLAVGIAVTARSERSLVEERLGRYLDDEQVAARESLKERRSPLGDIVNRFLEGSNWGDKMARDLARADLKLKASEYLAARVILGVGGAGIMWFLNRDAGLMTWVFTALGFVIGYMILRIWVGRKQGQRLIRFNEQLADMLQLMVNGLRAGYSNLQAMEAVAKELPSPISDEFRRVVQEIQLGLSVELALDNLLRRIPSEDLDLVVTAMNVQREVGGNLAEILDTISYTIRERVRIKGEIRVLTSQVMYSGRFLSMMPLIISAVLWFLNRDYMMQFFSEPRIVGFVALGIAAIMVISGYFLMTNIAKIEV